MAIDEPRLVRAAVAGDQDALAALLAAVGPEVAGRLAREIRPLFRRVLDVDDVLQVTYLEAFLRIARFDYRGPGSFAKWLSRIAMNNLRDAIRGLERQKRPPGDRQIQATDSASGAAGLLDRVGWTSTTPSRAVNKREMHETVLRALDRLPPDYAEVLRLYDLEGREVREVAAALQRSEGAFFMLRSRAIDYLRGVLCEGTDFAPE